MRRLILILSVLVASSAWGTVAVDTAQTFPVVVHSSSNVAQTTASFSTSANVMLIAGVTSVCAGCSQPVSTIDGTGNGLSWTKFKNCTNATSIMTSDLWYATSTSALSSVTVKSTWSAGSAQGVTLVVYSLTGADVAPLNGACTTGSVAMKATINASAAGSLLIGFGTDFNGTAQTALANSSKDDEYIDPSADTHTAFRLTTATSGSGNVTFGATSPTTDPVTFAAAEIPAGGGGGATVTPSRTMTGAGI